MNYFDINRKVTKEDIKKVFSEDEVKSIEKWFGGKCNIQTINNNPHLILLAFNKPTIKRLIEFKWLEEIWLQRQESYAKLNSMNFRDGDTYQNLLRMQETIGIEMFEWLVKFRYFSIIYEDYVTTGKNERNERKIASFLNQRINDNFNTDYDKNFVNTELKAFERLNFELTDEQRQAVHDCLSRKLNFVFGNAGSGKTTSLRAVVYVLQRMEAELKCVSPTGKAAKRLSEVTKVEATTIHSLLKIKTKEDELGDIWEENKKSVGDYLIVDEASMLSISLLAQLIEKTKDLNIIFVGDNKQLPSVEPGNFLSVIYKESRYPKSLISVVKRQSFDSGILEVANKIITKNPQEINWSNRKDISFYDVSNYSIEKLKAEWLETIKLHGEREVVILCPMKDGVFGTKNLNSIFRDEINPLTPTSKEIEYFDTTYRVGDLVMNTQNIKIPHFGEWIFIPNGEIGKVVDVAEINGGKEVVVEFDSIEHTFEREEISSLIHAYAITVHKSQGSEYKQVFFIFESKSTFMLTENLIYTGITRAKQNLKVIGSIGLFNRRSLIPDSQKRSSLFDTFLQEERGELEYE